MLVSSLKRYHFNCIRLLTVIFGLLFIFLCILSVVYPYKNIDKKTRLFISPPINKNKGLKGNDKVQTILNKYKGTPRQIPSTKTKLTTKTGTKTSMIINETAECPSILEGMTKGRWDAPKLTDYQFHEVWQDIKRSVNRMPFNHRTLQRQDLKCGNTTFEPTASYLRALCNPEGDTPCCENNICQSKTVSECRCENCFNLKSIIHPKYATWRPHNRRCKLTPFTNQNVCKLFDGWTVHFVGDSLIEGLSTALVMNLKGDLKTGGLRSDTPKNIVKRCVGTPQFDNGGVCKLHIDINGTFCDGSVKYEMNKFPSHLHGKNFTELVLSLQNKKKSVVLVHVGLHFKCDPDLVNKLYLKESFSKLKKDNSTWPLIIFGALPAPGPMKSPQFIFQDWDHVVHYNNGITKLLKQQYNVATIDFFQMSEGLFPYDGTHYGMSYNLNRANLFMHYFREWQSKHKY